MPERGRFINAGREAGNQRIDANQLPEAARSGVPIHLPDPQPEIRRNAEHAPDWEFREQAQFLYRWAVIFKGSCLIRSC